MSVKDIIEKLKAMDGIDEALIEELKGLDKKPETDGNKKLEKELKDAKAAQARILEEKKKLAEKTSELETTIEDLKSGGLSEVEKTQKELDKIVKIKEKLESELNEVKAKSATTERNYKLDKISSKIKFVDSIPEDMRVYAIQNAFKDVENLDDEDSVKNVITEFTESHKGILASDSTARGDGSVNVQTKSVKDVGTKDPTKISVEERAKQIRENQKNRVI